MRAYLLTAPTWLRCLMSGATFGVVFGLLVAAGSGDEGGWKRGLVVGVTSGVLFGGLMGLLLERELRKTRAILVDLPRAQQTAAIRATARGPAPDDPAVRHAALGLTQHSYRLNERYRRWGIAGQLLLMIPAIGLALTSSAWWWLAVLTYGVVLSGLLTSRRRFERRLDVLSDGELTPDDLRSRTTHEDDAQSSTPSNTVSLWIYVLAAPIVVLMGVALVRDPGRLGEESSVAGNVIGIVGVAAILTAILVGVWALSKSRFRTPLLAVQVAVIWGGGLLYAFEVRTEVSAWDVAEDAVLLATTLALVIPRRRSEG